MNAVRKRSSCMLRVEYLEDRSLPSTGLLLPGNDPLLTHIGKTPSFAASTMAANGDQNPYGVAFVPPGTPSGGKLHVGDILVSDFNNATIPGGGNVQGTGSSIVQVTPSGKTTTFFQGKSLLGLNTALGVLPGGFVIVGSTPSTTTAKGTTIKGPGELLILDRNGQLVETLKSPAFLNGPWDLTVNAQSANQAQVFVSNVLSGTVSRLDFFIPNHGKPVGVGATQIASGYATGTDPAAVVVGPTGLAYDANSDTLYVASTKDNRIYSINDASNTDHDNSKGSVVVKDQNGLHGPLGLVLDPNGDLIFANGDAPTVNPPPKGQQNLLLEYNRHGDIVGVIRLDPGVSGAAFGLALLQQGNKVHFAAVNDNTTQVEVWNLTQV
jgi:hypothetical protein